MGIRNTAKAIILDQGKILLNQNRNSIGEMCYGMPNGTIYYDLPGGGQNQYETLEEAVKRECLEESGYTVVVERMAAIYEEISLNEQLRREYEAYAHKVFFVFLCHLVNVPRETPAELDINMLESVWVNLDDLTNIPLYPQKIRNNLNAIIYSDKVSFLGSQQIGSF